MKEEREQLEMQVKSQSLSLNKMLLQDQLGEVHPSSGSWQKYLRKTHSLGTSK